MSLYKKILLLLDCSKVDEVIIDHVLKLSQIHKSSVHLFHVVHAHTLDQERYLIEKTKECFEKAENFFKDNQIEVTNSYKLGEPEDEVLKIVNEGNWDLVCLATHGHKGIKDFLEGSVSDVLKHSTDKPILMIRGKLK
ncbi:universal stress protein A [Thermotomaculum hydrothermale]|uniref:Universal stress protein A n=1 Tax=Thermotomaculum hydrothermale TaxID=981385 RepID=A0A7R6PHC8_9BACT|nr:universal stress protein [Thermotomaculum hydrothermale]BBB32619.1 universal stress protein A [Thermotomaculum hydrothermale]